jgi:14-3-3 protein epsilon
MSMAATHDVMFLVRLYHQLSRPTEALALIGELVNSAPSFSEAERNLFVLVYKSAIDPLRQTIRTLQSFEAAGDHPECSDMLAQYRNQAVQELTNICQHGTAVIRGRLLPAALDPRSTAFFLKLTGDLTRYITEFAPSDQIPSLLEEISSHYDKGLTVANTSLHACDPVRLGLILNMSVFAYEQLGDKDRAQELLQHVRVEVSDEGIAELPVEHRHDAIETLRAMKQNLVMWSGGPQEESNPK